MARARAGEAKQALPRLLELALTDGLERVELTAPFDLLGELDWPRWPAAERDAIEELLDTWWEWTRTASEPQLSPGVVLACLCRVGVPQIRWLGPWLDDLDGPTAQHLARIVIEQLPEPEWEGIEDERSQILGWTRTEPVVIGLTVVGGVHLHPGQLSVALDHML